MKKSLFCACLFFSIQANSQVTGASASPGTLNIGGGSAKIEPSFIVDWSIGESTIIDSYFGEQLNVTSGLLQPFDKEHIIFNPLIPAWTREEIRIYPVPSPDIVFIDFRSITTGKISVQLLSMEGRVLDTKKTNQVNGNGTQVWNIANKTPGIYYFRILLSGDSGRILKHGTYKIQKIK